MPDRKENKKNNITPSKGTHRQDQAEGGEEPGETEIMVNKTPGQAEGEREAVEEEQDEDEAAARKIAHQQWPNAALKGGLGRVCKL